MEKLKEIKINTEFIKMPQLLKLANVISQGSDAKFYVQQGDIFLDNVVVHELRKKVYPGSIVTAKVNNEIIKLKVV